MVVVVVVVGAYYYSAQYGLSGILNDPGAR